MRYLFCMCVLTAPETDYELHFHHSHPQQFTSFFQEEIYSQETNGGTLQSLLYTQPPSELARHHHLQGNKA
ncbi:hypothetical protein LXL04_028852 [Taraxacum kok-saghyz]